MDELRASTSATLTVADAAAILGVDPRTVGAGVADGSIPAIRLGRRVLILREKFLALFDASRIASEPGRETGSRR
ncbi:MAG: helix-turn-helix domain-containing protein [Actinobacteria bacterium]|nr:helix-turn-helix domain-containing protein [Actinomycetota bacterium]MBU1608929.1 helix-turn-helix domain-containing protein [Actinomycetota bacterium]MBU2316370.1 helix-turn-helix domain-containing protein [Actinomycetota bacterium]MBU2384060.1 helix-turn-helix domain-containing protein [Actinomycetota bacterium]